MHNRHQVWSISSRSSAAAKFLIHLIIVEPFGAPTPMSVQEAEYLTLLQERMAAMITEHALEAHRIRQGEAEPPRLGVLVKL
jgi:hypothetical protein